MMTDEVDIKALANLKGFGEAGKVIREKIDPYWGLGVKTETYKITITETIHEHHEITVVAMSEAEAEEKALKQCCASGDMEVVDIEILEDE